MRAVNLLPPDSYAPKERLPYAHVVLGAALPVLAGALVYLGYSLEHSKVVDREDSLGVVQASIAALAPTSGLADESTQVAGERTTRLAALTSALGNRMPWDGLMGQIARVLPRGAWLTSLSAQTPTPSGSSTGTSASASPTGLTIQGYAPTHKDVADLLERLALVPGLSNVALASTLSSQVGAKTVIQFSLTAEVQHAAGPTPGAAS